MDTAHGQAPHVDLLYLPPDEGVREYDLDEKCGYGRVKQYLLAYWRRFAELYNRYHE